MHFTGNGKMDSPGHLAQYCSYTFMELETKNILCIITIKKIPKPITILYFRSYMISSQNFSNLPKEEKGMKQSFF